MPINWERESEPHPLEALHDMAELLRLVQYWRERCERSEEGLQQWRARKRRAALAASLARQLAETTAK